LPSRFLFCHGQPWTDVADSSLDGVCQAWTGYCAMAQSTVSQLHLLYLNEHRRPLAPSKFLDVCSFMSQNTMNIWESIL